MIDLEKRAHDIVVSILPELLRADKIQYFIADGANGEKFNSDDITETYCTAYEGVLKALREYGEF